MDNNIYDDFATIVNDSSMNDATFIAKQFTEKTCFKQSRPNDFMFSEHYTWDLLYMLSNCGSCSMLKKYITVRDWVSKIPVDPNVLEKVREYEIMEEEVEEEINIIVRKNRYLQRGDEDRPKKARRVHNSKEDIHKERFQQLRAGEFKFARGFSIFDYVYNEYIQFNQLALEGKINSKERSTWKDCVQQMLNNDNLGEYGKALFDTLCGNTTSLCDTMGKTWEDIIWIYLNEKIEKELDKLEIKQENYYEIQDEIPILSNQSIITLALDKDKVLDRGDPRILFHQVQIALLSDTIPNLMQKLCKGIINNEWDSNLYIKKKDIPQVLRFISTLILFGREYLNWSTNDTFTTQLLSAYSQLNARSDTFRPVVIACYAAKLSLNDQIRVYSEFLENFDGDKEECAIICRLGKEFGLDMHHILINTSKIFMTKAFEKPIPKSTTFEIIPPQQDNIHYELFSKAIQWLLFDKTLSLYIIESVNKVLVHFFAHRKIYLVQRMIDMLPEWVFEHLISENRLKHQTVIEFELNRKVMLVFTKYQKWETLKNSEPKDSGSLEDLQAIYAWKDEFERETIKLKIRMLEVLDGNWLKEDSNLKNYASRVAIRQVYIPEIRNRYDHCSV